MGKTNREIANEVKQAIGVDVFSKEHQILTLLHDAGFASHKDLSCLLSASAATLDRRLAVLAGKGLISSGRDHADLRRRSYSLTPKARAILEEELAYFLGWSASGTSLPGAAGDLPQFVANLQARLGIGVLDQKYKIIISAFSNGGASTLSIFDTAGLPQGSFYNKLKQLKDAGILQSIRDHQDERRLQIFLSDRVVRVINEAHFELNSWISEIRSKAASSPPCWLLALIAAPPL